MNSSHSASWWVSASKRSDLVARLYSHSATTASAVEPRLALRSSRWCTQAKAAPPAVLPVHPPSFTSSAKWPKARSMGSSRNFSPVCRYISARKYVVPAWRGRLYGRGRFGSLARPLARSTS